MEWESIIVAVITSGVIITIIEIVRDWRDKKKAAKTANKESEYTAQKKGLDLVQEFYEKVSGVLNSNSNEIVARLDKIEMRMGDIEKYLNGGFKEFKQKAIKK